MHSRPARGKRAQEASAAPSEAVEAPFKAPARATRGASREPAPVIKPAAQAPAGGPSSQRQRRSGRVQGDAANPGEDQPGGQQQAPEGGGQAGKAATAAGAGKGRSRQPSAGAAAAAASAKPEMPDSQMETEGGNAAEAPAAGGGGKRGRSSGRRVPAARPKAAGELKSIAATAAAAAPAAADEEAESDDADGSSDDPAAGSLDWAAAQPAKLRQPTSAAARATAGGCMGWLQAVLAQFVLVSCSSGNCWWDYQGAVS